MSEISEQEEARNILAISIADRTQSRLVEGLAPQLNLKAVVVQDRDLEQPEFTSQMALLVADEEIARAYRMSSRHLKPGDGIQPALVAVVPASGIVTATSLARTLNDSFDGVLALPQVPATVLAQLSIILYAHRATVRRFDSAMDELHLNRSIFSSVTSGISVANALEPDLPLVYVNPAFEVITGYSLEEIEGQNCRFLQRDERNQPGLTLIREALREGRETVAIIRNYKKDGTPFWNELALSPIHDRNGRMTHVVGIQNDVTSRVTFEEALRESEKLAAVGRLAASIAHEINNPLESVTNLIYLARREPSEDARNGYLDGAERELHRVSHLTHQSLRFYKQSTAPQAVQLSALISSVLDVYSAKLSNAEIRVERRDRTGESVVCFESEIRQVLSNLIRNAMEAMHKSKGRLLIRVRPATDWGASRKGVRVTIADTGTGMSAETQGKLYTAFYTTKGDGGNGLGMWVSSEIVQRHHGRLSLRSCMRPGQSGTVFTLFLPYQAQVP